MAVDFEEILFQINEELRTQSNNNLHCQLRREQGGGRKRVHAILQLESSWLLRPSGVGMIGKSVFAANEWQVRSDHAASIAERLEALNSAVRHAPGPDVHLLHGRGVQGTVLLSTIVTRHELLEFLGLSRAVKANQEFVREVFSQLPSATQRDFQAVVDKITDGFVPTKPTLKPPKPYGGFHYKLAGTSALVNIHYIEGEGRCLVANEHIPAGATLCYDAGYCSVPLPSCWYSHCHNCGRRALAVVPCICCSSVTFCSVQCRDVGRRRFHETECAILQHLLCVESHQTAALLVVRTLATAGWATLSKYLAHCDQTRPTRVDKHQSFDPAAYDTMFHQASGEQRYSVVDVTQGASLAIYICRCLQLTHMIPSDDLTWCLQLQIITLIYRHLANVDHFVQPLREPRFSEDVHEEVLYETVGMSFNPVVALVNHSCFANTICTNDGATVCLQSVRPLDAGDQVTVCYSAPFYTTRLTERCKYLHTRYNFTCSCAACENRWPLYDQLHDRQIPHEARRLLEHGSCLAGAGRHDEAIKSVARAVHELDVSTRSRTAPPQFLIRCLKFLERSIWLKSAGLCDSLALQPDQMTATDETSE